MLSKYGNCTCVCVCSKLKTSWKSVVFTNEVGKNSRYFVGVFNKTIIPLMLVGYEMIIANSALRASLAIYHLISNAHLWNYSWLQLTSIPSTRNWKPPLLKADISHKQTLGHGLNGLETNTAFFNFDRPFVYAS